MNKKMKSRMTGVIFDYNPLWEQYPEKFEVIEEPKKRRRRKSKAPDPKPEATALTDTMDIFDELVDS